MPTPIPEWKTRECPTCGAAPGEACLTEAKKKATNPHTTRSGKKTKAYGKKLVRRRELGAERVEEQARKREYRRLPLDEALKARERAQMEAFRVRKGVDYSPVGSI